MIITRFCSYFTKFVHVLLHALASMMIIHVSIKGITSVT